MTTVEIENIEVVGLQNNVVWAQDPSLPATSHVTHATLFLYDMLMSDARKQQWLTDPHLQTDNLSSSFTNLTSDNTRGVWNWGGTMTTNVPEGTEVSAAPIRVIAESPLEDLNTMAKWTIPLTVLNVRSRAQRFGIGIRFSCRREVELTADGRYVPTGSFWPNNQEIIIANLVLTESHRQSFRMFHQHLEDFVAINGDLGAGERLQRVRFSRGAVRYVAPPTPPTPPTPPPLTPPATSPPPPPTTAAATTPPATIPSGFDLDHSVPVNGVVPDCWTPCYGYANCPNNYCGTHGACCRRNWPTPDDTTGAMCGKTTDGKSTVGGVTKHECVLKASLR